ncbi:MAG: C4-dicarboxylate ABC transporter [Sulfuricurvum sp. PC08-66]|nr:MAG: C4-dicarboxylate ABC transporter [Sulfuricurvum sp. PC08-66]
MALLMFGLALTLLMIGFPVAFVFAGVAILFSFFVPEVGFDIFELLAFRLYGIMQNFTLMSVPLFILMGLILEKSEMAKQLLVAMGQLFGSIRGGLAVSVILVSAMLAASTGIVGASVVMMSVIALPLMVKHGYDKALSAGTVAAGGTLGQIIPPSVVLIVLADQMALSVGDLFRAALIPSLLLVGAYLLYVLLCAWIAPAKAPAIPMTHAYRTVVWQSLKAITAPLLLMVMVLGSIFAGFASPTESGAIGVVGAILLGILQRALNVRQLFDAAKESAILSGMIFMILFGATAFSLVFNELGGSEGVVEFFALYVDSPYLFLGIAMLLIFILGFFIDFMEIVFIFIPIMVPIVHLYGIDPIWFAVLVALNLQASFLTPPFGFALFFLKGSARELVSTWEIYKGVMPYILLQLAVLLAVMAMPILALYLVY